MKQVAATAWMLSVSLFADAQQTATPEKAEAIRNGIQALQALGEQSLELDGVAKAKFLPQCEAVAASEAYCACVYERLPVLYTWFADDPWLLFVASIRERKYLGAMGDQPDTDHARLNLYFQARQAVQECAAVR